jgi:hypothetical protein
MQKVEGSSPFSRFQEVPVSKPLEPCAEAGHPGRLGLLYGDQQLVGKGCTREEPAGGQPLSQPSLERSCSTA